MSFPPRPPMMFMGSCPAQDVHLSVCLAYHVMIGAWFSWHMYTQKLFHVFETQRVCQTPWPLCSQKVSSEVDSAICRSDKLPSTAMFTNKLRISTCDMTSGACDVIASGPLQLLICRVIVDGFVSCPSCPAPGATPSADPSAPWPMDLVCALQHMHTRDMLTVLGFTQYTFSI